MQYVEWRWGNFHVGDTVLFDHYRIHALLLLYALIMLSSTGSRWAHMAPSSCSKARLHLTKHKLRLYAKWLPWFQYILFQSLEIGCSVAKMRHRPSPWVFVLRPSEWLFFLDPPQCILWDFIWKFLNSHNYQQSCCQGDIHFLSYSALGFRSTCVSVQYWVCASCV